MICANYENWPSSAMLLRILIGLMDLVATDERLVIIIGSICNMSDRLGF